MPRYKLPPPSENLLLVLAYCCSLIRCGVKVQQNFRHFFCPQPLFQHGLGLLLSLWTASSIKSVRFDLRLSNFCSSTHLRIRRPFVPSWRPNRVVLFLSTTSVGGRTLRLVPRVRYFTRSLHVLPATRLRYRISIACGLSFLLLVSAPDSHP